MITFSVLLFSIFVVPVIGSTIAFRYFFPKHAIKLSDSFLVTLGTSLTILVNLPLIYFVFKCIVPESIILDGPAILTEVVRSIYKADYIIIFSIGLMIIFLPIFIAIGFFYFLKNSCWAFYCVNLDSDENSLGWWETAKYRIGESISNSVLNYMANLTICDEANEVLLVDILDSQDSLYSGIYTDFFVEKGEFAGISIVNTIRYSFKNEKERKEKKDSDETIESLPANTANKKEKPYILPRLGEMYFPRNNIQNLHFWKIKRGHVFTKKVENAFDESLVVWYLLIQNAFKEMKFSVKAYNNKPNNEPWITFTKGLENFSLDLSSFSIGDETEEKKDISPENP